MVRRYPPNPPYDTGHPDPPTPGRVRGEYICHWSMGDFSHPVTLETLEKDWCCSVAVAGPYSDPDLNLGPVPFSADGSFTASQKTKLKNANTSNGMFYMTSDAMPPGIDATIDYHSVLYFSLKAWTDDDDPELTPYYWARPDSAEVDHIVPRRDTHGCPCGSNDWSNAAVISRQLNGEMSNNCDNPGRLAMLASFPAP